MENIFSCTEDALFRFFTMTNDDRKLFNVFYRIITANGKKTLIKIDADKSAFERYMLTIRIYENETETNVLHELIVTTNNFNSLLIYVTAAFDNNFVSKEFLTSEYFHNFYNYERIN